MSMETSEAVLNASFNETITDELDALQHMQLQQHRRQNKPHKKCISVRFVLSEACTMKLSFITMYLPLIRLTSFFFKNPVTSAHWMQMISKV
jgi:hypothetical protein